MNTQRSLFTRRGIARTGTLAVLGFALTACALNKKASGGIIGAGAGAGVGAVIGNNTGSTARGAIIGAVVGGLAGTIIGNQMDQQAKGIKQTVAGATVERVGQGIQVTFASGLLFGFDSEQILSDAATNLHNLAVSLNQYPNTDVLIVGHTDASGTTDYNQALSERRAQAASDYLISQGVAASRLRTVGRGELEPVASNDTDAGRALNRRVEVAIFANAAARNSAGQ
ncbi:MAG TPA: OmpA family protein [Gemmatimonadaceae bacterium]|nr:OmpA family protein [Gemmatimonadaceae bacterium]